MKAIVQIESYDNGKLVIFSPDFGVKSALKRIYDTCQKYSGYAKVEITPPYKSRTTGEGSQNNKFYALVTEICKETGNDLEDVKDALKERAVKRGFPYRVNPLTNQIKPFSTTKVNTVQMSYLIEEAIQLCAELGINSEDV